MKKMFTAMLGAMAFLSSDGPACAQKAPEAGYVFPAGGKAGTTIDVHLGGYDWTPDMEYVVHDPRVKLIASGPPGPILIPPPPYWFGAKGRLSALPLAREAPAKLVIPADVPPGPIYWQAANANGSTSARVFIVGAGPEVIEDENRTGTQLLASLPITMSGRLLKNEEVDRYRFVAPKDGPITCELTARRLGAKFHGMLDVYDAAGRLIADVLGAGGDPCLTFAAKASTEYVVSVRDIDFGGDRSYVYRLSIAPGPRVVGAIPAAAKHGEKRDIEFLVDNGTRKLDSIKRDVAFPAKGASFTYRLDTPAGIASAFPIHVSDEPGIAGMLDQPDAEGRHSFAWKRGDIWSLMCEAKRIGSPLDVALTIVGPDGKELAKNDDLPGGTDAGLDFTVPADGTYRIVVSDMAGKSGSRTAIYRLVVRKATPDFTLHVATQHVNVQLGGTANLPIQATRKGGFKGPITLAVKGLPDGVSVPANLVIPGDKAAFALPLQASKDASAVAGLITIEGTADLAPITTGIFSRSGPPRHAGPIVTRAVMARTNVNLSPRHATENDVARILVATTLKPRFKGQPVDQDTGRKVPRGSTFPADVILERLEGFQGDIILQMAATQSYQVQGITGGDVLVPPGVTKTIYPCYMPEWLETTRTSRMGMIGVAKVADPKGKIRYACNGMTGFVTMTMEGALLKLSTETEEMMAVAGKPFDVHLKVARVTNLKEPVRLELKLPPELARHLNAEPMTLAAAAESAVLRITAAPSLCGAHVVTIRATALVDGRYPAISETCVAVDFGAAERHGPER